MQNVTAHTECEVRIDDGTWHPGMIAEWRQDDDGAWTAWVRYRSPDGNRIDVLPAHRVRPLEP